MPSGSGLTRQAVLTVTNVGSAASTVGLAVSGASAGIDFTVDQPTLALGVGESAQVTVTMTAAKGISVGGKQATLVVSDSSGPIARAVLFALVNP